MWYQLIIPEASESRNITEEDIQRFVAGIAIAVEILLRWHTRCLGSNTYSKIVIRRQQAVIASRVV